MSIDAASKQAIAEESARRADAHGMVEVVAAKSVRDNGRYYRPGDRLHMHQDLLPSHVATGQVKLPDDGGAKQQPTPRDKQARPGETKSL